MKDILLIAGFLAFWITLNRWILPWFGIETCMSGGCCSNPSSRHCPVDETALPSETDADATTQPLDTNHETSIRSDQVMKMSRAGR